MTCTALRPAGRHDYDIIALDGEYLGSAASPLEAEQRAAAYRFEQLRHAPPEDCPAEEPEADPLDLYAGAPAPCTAIDPEWLARAYAHFFAHHPARQALQPAPATDDPIAAAAARAFSALQQRAWEGLPDGALEIAGSAGTIYRADDSICRVKGRTRKDGSPLLCPSHRFQQHRHGGECYHLISRELVRLAQVLARQETPATATPDGAFVTIGGTLLGHALALVALAEQAVTFTVRERRLKIAAGDALVHGVALLADDGAGSASLTLDRNAFASLWATFRPVARQHASLQLVLDPGAGQLLLCSEGFCAMAPGRAKEES